MNAIANLQPLIAKVAVSAAIISSLIACGPATDKATDTSGIQGVAGFKYRLDKVAGTTNSHSLVVTDDSAVRTSYTIMGLSATDTIPPVNVASAIRVQHVLKGTVTQTNPLVVNFMASDTRMVIYQDTTVGGGIQVSTAGGPLTRE
jgi:hypothetical protein